MKIKKMFVLSCFFCFFNYESLVIVVSIIEFTIYIYILDGLILDLCISNYWFDVYGFEMCDIGMKIGIWSGN